MASPNNDLDGRERVIAALLFLHADPVDLSDLSQWTGTSLEELHALLDQLSLSLYPVGLSLHWTQDQICLTTAPDLHERLTSLLDEARTEPKPLSHGAWETLAVVAYRQPITRLEVEAYRQAGSERTLTTLQERGLIEEVGRKETPGRPILYGTTAYFLQQFGLSNLKALPPLNAEGLQPPEV